jgi:AcrR family transcriptional regulator
MAPPPSDAREATRQALLDAAYDAAVAGTWARSRMADVAAAAGVSRQTLYNEFGTKDGLAAALAARETGRFLTGTAAAMDGEPDPVSAVRAATAYTLAEAADNPLLKAVLTDTTPELLPFLTTRAEAVFATATARITAELLRRWPALAPADVGLATEATVRLTVSYLVSPSGPVAAMSDRVATVAARVLAPRVRAPQGGTSA